MRAGLAEFLGQDQFSHAITLNPNRGNLHPGRLEEFFKAFCMEMDRLKHGQRRVHRLPTAERFNAIGFPEKLLSNAHIHLAADLRFTAARGMSDNEIEASVDTIWSKLTKGSGTVSVMPIRDAGWAWYITKEAPRRDHVYFIAATYHAN